MKMLTNGLTHQFLAVNYRNKGEKFMGCWKGFDSSTDAWKWLQWRCNKTTTSPRGAIVLKSLEEVEREIKTTVHPSLKMALNSYLEFCKTVSKQRYY